MTDNLLRNAGFEGITEDGEWTRETHTGETHGNWFTPAGWVGWWDETRGRQRPEAHVIPFEGPYLGPPVRVHEGHYACKLHKSFAPWAGGHYQIVEGLTVGAPYQAGFWAHAWCNHDGLPHAGDPNCAPMGCGPLYRHQRDLPPLTGDPVSDAWHAAVVQVGVQFLEPDEDPEPTYDVLWGDAAAIYNAFAAVPMLTFEAETARAVVYLRCAFRWAYRNNDSYIDSAYLRLIDDPGPPYEYERYAVLLAPSTTLVEAQSIVAEHFEDRRSFSFSADDVANREPRCTRVTVKAYRPEEWSGKEALIEHWRTYFAEPDEVIWVDEKPPPPNPLLLAQRDPEWNGYHFGAEACGLTIGQAGCFITCLAMWQRAVGLDANATPVTVDTALGPQGYRGCTAAWGLEAELYATALRITIERRRLEEAHTHLDAGGLALAEVEPETVEHFVLVVRREGDRYWMRDPWQDVEGWLDEYYPAAESWRLLSQATPPPTDRSMVGLHVQAGVGYETQYVHRTGAPWKQIGGLGELLNAARARPDGFRVYRHWVPEQNLDRDPDEAMAEYVAEFSDSLYSLCEQMAADGIPEPYLGVEGWNETYGSFDPRIVNAIEMDRAFIRELGKLGLPVVAVAFCAAVGNPHESEFTLLADLARETAAAGGHFGYHNYWYANSQESGLVGHAQWLSHRWIEIDAALEDAGVDVSGLGWYSGELGAVGGHYVSDAVVEVTGDERLGLRVSLDEWGDLPRGNTQASDWKPLRTFIPGHSGYVLLPTDGWLSSKCYGGDWDRYERDLVTWHGMTQDWNAAHGDRARGGGVFTTFGDPPQGWRSFAFTRAQMERMAELLP